jgi:hypothetical protein
MMMECGIEAGDLLDTGSQRPDGSHRRQTARLVQRRKGRQRVHDLDRLIGDFDRAFEVAPAVNDAMPGGEQCAADEIIVAPVEHIGKQGLAIIVGRRATPLEQMMTGRVGHSEAWFGIVLVEQAFAQQVRLTARDIEQRI